MGDMLIVIVQRPQACVTVPVPESPGPYGALHVPPEAYRRGCWLSFRVEVPNVPREMGQSVLASGRATPSKGMRSEKALGRKWQRPRGSNVGGCKRDRSWRVRHWKVGMLRPPMLDTAAVQAGLQRKTSAPKMWSGGREGQL